MLGYSPGDVIIFGLVTAVFPSDVAFLYLYQMGYLVMFFFFSRIVVAMEDAPTNLFPPLAISAYSFRVVELIHRGLFEINDRLEPVPDLVESYSISFDGDDAIVLLKIKKGQRTCYGNEINSKMVADSIKKHMDYGRTRLVRSVSPLDEYSFVITAARNLFILYELALPVFPENWTDCTGDFEVIEFVPGYHVLLRHRKSNRIVLIKGVKNDITRILEFEKGDVDVLVNAVPPHLTDYVRSLKNVEIITQKSININYIAFNMKNPYLSKKEVRQAIFYALDREKIVRELMKDQAEVINSMIPSISPFYRDYARYSYNVTKAIELLKRAGLRKVNGYFFKVVWKTSTVRYALRNVKAMSSYLEDIGIKVEIVPQEFHKFFSDIVEGNYDVFSLNLVGIKTPDVFRFIAHSKSVPPKGANRTFFSNPYLDNLLDEAEREKDIERVKAIYERVQEVLMEEVPYIPIYQLKDFIVFRTDKIEPSYIRRAVFIPGGSLKFLNHIVR